MRANDRQDIEKGPVLAPKLGESDATPNEQIRDHENLTGKFKNFLQSFERRLLAYNLEARGIQRVEPDERHDLKSLGYMQIAIMWFSINLAANNITLGMLGPAIFHLGFLDSVLCSVLGMLVGCLAVAYTATFGPRSGNRTMIFARYTMGWYPVKIVVLLNIIVLLGYALIDCVIAGQILSFVSTNNMSIAVGIVIVAIIAWVVTSFGYQMFHYYERYAWLPQLVVLSILAGVAGPKFDVSSTSEGDPRTVIGNRISFFSLSLAAAITYGGGAADYLVYYPERTPRWKIFGITMIGLSFSFTFAFMLGIGLASGTHTDETFHSAYNVSQGALIVEGYRPLGSFGSFCSVVVALGLIANLVPPTYSSGIDFQILGRYLERVPRVVWNTIGVVIYTVCALAGRDHLAAIFTNFLALMGYWVSIWIAITLEEHLLFRRNNERAWRWDIWNRSEQLPLGIAAIVAFLVGWVGAILCMAQVWYIGPVAALVGEYGADMGNYVGFAWAAITFPPLRWWELKRFGR
ncbi:purine-cytosine permease FCY21 [Patellaria atrata CBS 101060]|uniref:Purine-cytosine permease FCY21 n=1 Tax=Patellaria atrata CBS 101060 TaxID=1346257 RepID=A0A9P4SDX7_9PEZI|nr:purine-cytosine permease FCY21 [Patellaria atrata CBS 101060]